MVDVKLDINMYFHIISTIKNNNGMFLLFCHISFSVDVKEILAATFGLHIEKYTAYFCWLLIKGRARGISDLAEKMGHFSLLLEVETWNSAGRDCEWLHASTRIVSGETRPFYGDEDEFNGCTRHLNPLSTSSFLQFSTFWRMQEGPNIIARPVTRSSDTCACFTS